jgi:MoaA/NifB/PqqE/SkfB family radical SAM enzyme
MKIYQLITKTFSNRAYASVASHKLIHAFDFFGIDYRLLAGYSFPPKSVCLILTDKCNLKCSMCDIGQANAHNKNAAYQSPLLASIQSGKDHLSTEEWLNILDDLARFVPKPLILLTGAEPFLNPDIMRIVEKIISKKFSLHITTNGTLLAQYAAHLVTLCRTARNMDITVSLDDIGEAHDTIRGVKGTFQRAIEGIQQVVSAREIKRQAFPIINITCTISNHNYKNLASFAEWFIEENVPIESINFNHLWFKDVTLVKNHNKQFGQTVPALETNIRGVDIRAIDMKTVYAQISQLKKRCAETHIRIHQEPDLSYAEGLVYYADPCRFVFSNRCTAPWRNVTITPKGNIILSPLCFLPVIDTIKEKPLSAIWNGAAFRRIRRQLKAVKAYPACARCCMLFSSRPKYYKIKSWLR